MNTFDDSDPPSDRQREDEYRHTMYGKLDAIHATVESFRWPLFIMVLLLTCIACRKLDD